MAKGDLKLLAGAFARDKEMAEQICGLIRDGHLTEADGRRMLGLVMDGHLGSRQAPCPLTHYPSTYQSEA